MEDDKKNLKYYGVFIGLGDISKLEVKAIGRNFTELCIQYDGKELNTTIKNFVAALNALGTH